jgi:hypothetical protein
MNELNKLLGIYPKYTGLINSRILRPKIFVSYHHGGDQYYYDEFSKIFHDKYEAIRDNSLRQIIDSGNPEYVMRRIREEYIVGTSCTIVLIGENSWRRKYLDWEIKATLDKCHALLGIVLPSHIKNPEGKILVPDRLHANIKTGYADLIHWQGLTAQSLTTLINAAVAKSKLLIDNSFPMKQRNG